MAHSRTPSALEAVARLRTMRALMAGEDRQRFERLVSEVEEAVCETETLMAELARVAAAGVIDGAPSAIEPIELTDIVAAALREVDDLLATRGVMVDVDAPRPIFVIGQRQRLERLIVTTLAIAIRATPPRGHAQLRYAQEDSCVAFRLAPYAARDPRETIVTALALSQGVQVKAAADALLMLLPAVPLESVEPN